MTLRTHRRGLTLPEVLVTLAIVAVIAAVLVPALTSQITKGDAGRVSEDLKAVQSGVSAFVSDVRRFPDKLNHLTNVIVATSQTDINGSSYTATHVNRWKGPYFAKEITAGATNFSTGYGGSISADLTTSTIVNNVAHVVVTVTGLSQTEEDNVDAVLDDGVSSTGVFRSNLTDAQYFSVVIQ